MYEVPASHASIAQNRFEFRVPGSKKTWSLPKLQYLRADQSGQLGKLTRRLYDPDTGKVDPERDVDAAIALTELQQEIVETYCPGLYGLIDQDQLSGLLAAWNEASSINLGESSASSTS